MAIAADPVDTSAYSAAVIPNDELLGAMLDAHRQSAFNLAYRLVRRPEDAADAVQDAFVLAVRAARGDTAAPRDAGRFRPWLLKIVANVALGQLRRKRADAIVSLDELTAEPADPHGEQPLTALTRRERRGDVLNALLVLPDDQRIALTLREYQELSYDEIGEIMDRDRAAVTALIYRARCAFRRAYQGLAERSAPIGCPELAPLVSAMLDEELDVGTWQHVEQHVAGCRRCRFELRQLRGARRLHATIPLLAPPAGWPWAATLEAAQAVGGVGAASLASPASTFGPAIATGTAVDAPAIASLGGVLASLGGPLAGPLAGRLSSVALIVGLHLGIMVGAPTHQSTQPPVVQAATAPPPLGAAAPGASGQVAAPVEGADFTADAQPAASSGPASAGPSSAAASFSSGGAMPAAGPPGASAPSPARASTSASASVEPVGQSQPSAVAAPGSRADATISPSGPPVDEAAVQAANAPSAAGVAADGGAHGWASTQPATGVTGAGPEAGAGAVEPATTTVAAVVDVVSGLPQGQVPPVNAPPIDLPPIDPPAIDLPPIDVPPVSLPVGELPPVDLPPIDVQAVEIPTVDLPAFDVPEIEVPAVALSAIDVPEIDVEAVDLPDVDLSEIDVEAIDPPTIDLPALGAHRDQARGVADAVRSRGPSGQQTFSSGAALEVQSAAGSGRVDASLPSDGDDSKGGGRLVEVTAGALNTAGNGGGAHVEAGVNAPNTLTEGSNVNTLVDASIGTSSGANDGGGNTLSVHTDDGTSNASTSLSVSVDSGSSAGTLETSGAGGLDTNGSVSVSVESSSGSGSLESSTSISVSLDNGSNGGGNDSNSSGGSTLSVSAEIGSDSSSSDSNGSNSSGGGGGISVSVGGISVSLP